MREKPMIRKMIANKSKKPFWLLKDKILCDSLCKTLYLVLWNKFLIGSMILVESWFCLFNTEVDFSSSFFEMIMFTFRKTIVGEQYESRKKN